MYVNDPEIAEIVKNSIPVEINGEQYIIQYHRKGDCLGCSFQGQEKCPAVAVTYCCSNGGNILIKHNNIK